MCWFLPCEPELQGSSHWLSNIHICNHHFSCPWGKGCCASFITIHTVASDKHWQKYKITCIFLDNPQGRHFKFSTLETRRLNCREFRYFFYFLIDCYLNSGLCECKANDLSIFCYISSLICPSATQFISHWVKTEPKWVGVEMVWGDLW